jgi:hypothetical protein
MSADCVARASRRAPALISASARFASLMSRPLANIRCPSADIDATQRIQRYDPSWQR